MNEIADAAHIDDGMVNADEIDLTAQLSDHAIGAA
jgi:hypothetical protein